MTSTEVRAMVVAYYRIRSALKQALPRATREDLNRLEAVIRGACYEVCSTSAPSRWARQHVGSVLAAGLGAATSMREDVPSAGGALRVFGLTGERPLTSAAALTLMQPYLRLAVLSNADLTEIARLAGLRLHRLPEKPGPADLLVELTRPRASSFCVLLAHWISERFRSQAEPGYYTDYFRNDLAALEDLNARGELANLSGAAAHSPRLSREEWVEIIHGRVPRSRLEQRAAFLTVKQFIADYWEQWNQVEAPKVATG